MVVALVVLVLLIVFVAENTQRSTVNFFGLHGSAPTSVVVLIAAVAGALIVVSVGAARLAQLRLSAHRAERSAPSAVGHGSGPEALRTTADPQPGATAQRS